MSGAEVITTVQLIDACIGITRTIIEIGEAARDAQGLPDRLRELFERLPAIEDVLELARENYGNVPDGERESVKPMLKQCNTSLEELRMILWKAFPGAGENYGKRVVRGTKTVILGRENKLLRLLDTILGNLKLLEQMKVYNIGDRLQSLSETVQSLADDTSSGYYNTHNGSGDQNIHQGSGNMYNQRGGDHSTFHQHFAAPLTRTDDLCLQSLAFPDMETRGDIDPKTDQTCEWISQHPKYLEWRGKGGLLWIKGRPGTGKSTLMEYLRKANLPDPDNTGEGETLVLSFFFHRRGHELQQTPLGLFRSLLHQILRCDQEILSDFVTDTRFEARYRTEGEPGKDKKWNWTAPVLQELLTKCIFRTTESRKLRLYIDALDESGEKAARALTEYLGNVHTRAAGRLEICISCRPWPDVIHGWHFCIDIVEENAHDIKQLLRERLGRWLASSAEIENEIASRASGVFQWAVIVVERVLSLRKADTATILANIRDAPGNLDDIYHEMINKLTGADRKAASRLFRWITFAKRPLSLTEIRHAVAMEANSEVRSSQDCHSSTHWCDSDEQMREKLKRLSFALVRIAASDGMATVQFDHESVQDYMTTRGLVCLQNPQSMFPGTSICTESESILSLVCFRYLACPDIVQVWHEMLIETPPFAAYATAYCWIHTSHAESGAHFGGKILNITQWPEMKIACTTYMPGPILDHGPFFTEYGRESTMQHLAAYHGISSVIRHLISRIPEDSRIVRSTRKRADFIDARDSSGRTPLWYAASEGHVSVLKLLLGSRRVDINAKDNNGQTLFAVAAHRGHEDIICLLLEENVDFEAKDKDGRTALLNAAYHDNKGIVQVLLKHVEGNAGLTKKLVNTRDHLGWTPLMAAAAINSPEIVRLLLETDNVDINATNSTVYRETAPWLAAYRGHEQVVRALLRTGRVDINARCMNLPCQWLTPLEAAEKYGRYGTVDILRKYKKERSSIKS